ncbi:hypothetical protein IAR55_003402 [Kwoniella newhampshirensis]|uniref:Uncharacterized protein n=1 Tax=Kwoniella newhampshirensis TaxID=1651941 RepID=A0AAW0YYQ6_9TREE
MTEAERRGGGRRDDEMRGRLVDVRPSDSSLPYQEERRSLAPSPEGRPLCSYDRQMSRNVYPDELENRERERVRATAHYTRSQEPSRYYQDDRNPMQCEQRSRPGLLSNTKSPNYTQSQNRADDARSVVVSEDDYLEFQRFKKEQALARAAREACSEYGENGLKREEISTVHQGSVGPRNDYATGLKSNIKSSRSTTSTFSPGYGFRPRQPDSLTLPSKDELVSDNASRHRIYPAPAPLAKPVNAEMGWTDYKGPREEPRLDDDRLTPKASSLSMVSEPMGRYDHHHRPATDVTRQVGTGADFRPTRPLTPLGADIKRDSVSVHSIPTHLQQIETPPSPTHSVHDGSRKIFTVDLARDPPPHLQPVMHQEASTAMKPKKTAYIPWEGGVVYKSPNLNNGVQIGNKIRPPRGGTVWVLSVEAVTRLGLVNPKATRVKTQAMAIELFTGATIVGGKRILLRLEATEIRQLVMAEAVTQVVDVTQVGSKVISLETVRLLVASNVSDAENPVTCHESAQIQMVETTTAPNVTIAIFRATLPVTARSLVSLQVVEGFVTIVAKKDTSLVSVQWLSNLKTSAGPATTVDSEDICDNDPVGNSNEAVNNQNGGTGTGKLQTDRDGGGWDGSGGVGWGDQSNQSKDKAGAENKAEDGWADSPAISGYTPTRPAPSIHPDRLRQMGRTAPPARETVPLNDDGLPRVSGPTSTSQAVFESHPEAQAAAKRPEDDEYGGW